MAQLTEPQKRAIVRQLAQYKRHAEVSAVMREEFDLELTVQQIRTYDPTSPFFAADRDKWEPIFLAEREAYTTDMKEVACANQAFRLNELHDIYKRVKAAKNYKFAAEILEQIARECGGALTNRREVDVSDSRRPRDMPMEDQRALLASMIAEGMEKRKLEQQQEQPTKH